MNARGYYGGHGVAADPPPVRQVSFDRLNCAVVGAELLHVLELKQRYENVPTEGMQALLADLSKDGTSSALPPAPGGLQQWEIALRRDAVWVRVSWDFDFKVLTVTITDKQLRPVGQVRTVRDHYEAILSRKITPRLTSFPSTVVAAAFATFTGQVVPSPRLAARTRAIRAVFDMYTRRGGRAPFYLYSEVNGVVDKRSALSIDEANTLFSAIERAPGEVYVSIFDPMDPSWPNPAFDVYRAAPVERRALVGQGSYFGHTPGEVEDELDQLHGEIMAFGQQLQALVGRSEAQRIQQKGSTDLRKIEEEYQALKKLEETFLPLVREVDRIKEKLASNPTSPPILLELRDAMFSLNKVMAPDKRADVVRRLRILADKLSEAKAKIIREGASSLELWDQDAWTPFFNSWMKFRELKKKPAQTWPLSGTWDRIQEYRQQFVDLYDRAPFKPSGPRPLDPKGRKDPSLFGDVRSVLKWGLIGALGIGGVVAVSAIASKLKKGRGS